MLFKTPAAIVNPNAMAACSKVPAVVAKGNEAKFHQASMPATPMRASEPQMAMVGTL